MAILQFANNASSTLAQNITGVDTTIYLAAGEGSLFPIPTANKNFYATIYNISSTLWEIVLVTARNSDTLTVVRAQEGTTAQTWLVGDSLGMYPTAATMNQLIQIDQLQQGTYNVAQAGGSANALTCSIISDLTSIPDAMTLVVKPAYANTGAATLQVTMGSTVLSAVPIVKGPNLAIEANDIPSAGYPVQLIYSAIYGAWVMQMPSTLISPPVPPTYTISYIAVGGGGGSGAGGTNGGGGGGAFIGTSTTGLVGTTLTVYIGAGGVGGGTGGGTLGLPGNPSQIIGVTYSAGGGGATRNGGTSGNGYGGGFYDNQGGGGGGGSAGGGFSGSNIYGGNGGPGSNSLIEGASLFYAGGGGGGGGGYGGSGGSGGSGGGGNGGYYPGYEVPPQNGLVNSGGGGGGGAFNYPGYAGNGGSGLVVLSVPTARYSGFTTGSPTIFTSGANTVIKFTSSGTYTV